MSTNKGWTSCQNIYNKDNVVEEEVKEGTVIAYLIRKGDTQIRNPICRVLIKPYYNKEYPEKKPYYVINKQVYGTNVPGFIKAVEKFFDEKNKQVEDGIYKIPKGGYTHGFKYNEFVKV
jgi:hypothetical protein